jgi:hypothetical protein
VTDTATADVFSDENLHKLSRDGAVIFARTRDRCTVGARVRMLNGFEVSVQWGPCLYADNYDADFGEPLKPSRTAEIGVFTPAKDGLMTWADGDTVQGWVPWDKVQHILDLAHAGDLDALKAFTKDDES